jgi:hypothetical protein
LAEMTFEILQTTNKIIIYSGAYELERILKRKKKQS